MCVTQLSDSGGTLSKKIYIGSRMEQEENPDGQGGWTNTLIRIFVSTPTGVIGIEERTPSTTTRKYLHRDHLGSVVAVSGEPTTGNAPILAEYSFDAWGALRNPSDWTAATNALTASASGDRGFTGHEMLDDLNLVHMNGRIYSQELGRFLSADPIIQAPENLQSFNRYSYVFNNPLTHTDPSGFAAKTKKASSEAATASTQLAENVSSTEISSQDNVGGTTAESSTQAEDYYSDSYGNTQVDQTTQASATTTAPGDESIGSTADSSDQSSYGTGTGTKSEHTPTEIYRAALLAQSAYDDKGAPEGFTRGQAYRNPDSGFYAVCFTEDSTGKEYLVFRGTDNPVWTGKDWVANGGNSLRGYSAQMNSALSATKEVMQATGGNLTVIGHSLGGALAGVSAQANDIRAITFNASGVKGPIDESSNITALYVSSEALSSAQDNTFLPSAGGNRIALPAVPVEGSGRLELHSMDSVLRSLEAAGYRQ